MKEMDLPLLLGASPNAPKIWLAILKTLKPQVPSPVGPERIWQVLRTLRTKVAALTLPRTPVLGRQIPVNVPPVEATLLRAVLSDIFKTLQQACESTPILQHQTLPPRNYRKRIASSTHVRKTEKLTSLRYTLFLLSSHRQKNSLRGNRRRRKAP